MSIEELREAAIDSCRRQGCTCDPHLYLIACHRCGSHVEAYHADNCVLLRSQAARWN